MKKKKKKSCDMKRGTDSHRGLDMFAALVR